MRPWYHLNSDLKNLHSVNTGIHAVHISDIAFPITVEIPLKSTQIMSASFRFKAQRLLPYTLHEDFHQPSSLYFSGVYVLLLVNAVLMCSFRLY